MCDGGDSVVVLSLLQPADEKAQNGGVTRDAVFRPAVFVVPAEFGHPKPAFQSHLLAYFLPSCPLQAAELSRNSVKESRGLLGRRPAFCAFPEGLTPHHIRLSLVALLWTYQLFLRKSSGALPSASLPHLCGLLESSRLNGNLHHINAM